jgi:hypothetical protein
MHRYYHITEALTQTELNHHIQLIRHFLTKNRSKPNRLHLLTIDLRCNPKTQKMKSQMAFIILHIKNHRSQIIN